jgi:hypothetical protein
VRPLVEGGRFVARASSASGASGTYEDCVDHCIDKLPGNSPELTECIRGCATVYGGGRLGADIGTVALSEEAWGDAIRDFLGSDKSRGMTTIFRAIGPGGGSTMDCFGQCETEYSRCQNNAGDWFQRYLCKLDALSCVAGCVGRKLPSGVSGNVLG